MNKLSEILTKMKLSSPLLGEVSEEVVKSLILALCRSIEQRDESIKAGFRPSAVYLSADEMIDQDNKELQKIIDWRNLNERST